MRHLALHARRVGLPRDARRVLSIPRGALYLCARKRRRHRDHGRHRGFLSGELERRVHRPRNRDQGLFDPLKRP